MQAETALLTFERGLTLTIRLFAMPTLGAGTTRVPGVNKPDRNARPGCFVGNVHPQLIESPGMPLVAVFVTNSDRALSDTRQVFENQCLARLNGFVYQGFAHLVIHLFLKTLLTSRELLQATFRRASTNALQLSAAFVVASTNLVDFCSTEGLTRTIGCQLNHTKIDPKGIIRLSQFRSILALCDIEVVDATSPHQVSTADLPGADLSA